MVQCTAALLALVHALQKNRFVKSALQVHRFAQNRVLAHQRKHLAGHEGLELRHTPALHLHPFAVRAGKHHRGVVAARHVQGPKNLHLFAAHHVGCMQSIPAKTAQARHQRDAPGLQPQQVLTQLGKACGTGAVGRFLPALAAARHARDQAERSRRLQPVAKECLKHRFKLAGRHGEDAAWKFAGFEHLAGGTEPRTAQRRGAPVDGDQRSCTAHAVALFNGVFNIFSTASRVGKGVTAPKPCTESEAAALA